MKIMIYGWSTNAKDLRAVYSNFRPRLGSAGVRGCPALCVGVVTQLNTHERRRGWWLLAPSDLGWLSVWRTVGREEIVRPSPSTEAVNAA